MKRLPCLCASALAAILVLGVSASHGLDLQKLLDRAKLPGGAGATSADLSEAEIARGLKAALSQGARRAVSALGRTDGFLANPKVRIPMPDTLAKVESALRAFGQDERADRFVETLNRAAERAVPEAASIFGDAIESMTLDDARAILNGPDDAATDYLRRTSAEHLVDRFRPIVEDATDAAGVTAAYKGMVEKAGPAGRLLGTDAADLDGYVTREAVDGLFTMVAAEEKRIRTDPARATDLLQKVFSAR